MKNWEINETALFEENGKYESLFALANGAIGIRGFHEFFENEQIENTVYMNGFYDTEDYTYGEAAYGYAKKKQKMLALPHFFQKKLFVGDVQLESKHVNRQTSKRTLDIKRGVLMASYDFELSDGLVVRVCGERFVSLAAAEFIFQTYTITANQACSITLKEPTESEAQAVDGFDPRRGGLTKEQPLHSLKTQPITGGMLTHYQTDESKLDIVIGQSESLSVDGKKSVAETPIHLELGSVLTVQKAAYYSRANAQLESHAAKVEQVASQNVAVHLEAHMQKWDAFWALHDYSINDNAEIQTAILLNMFHLYQHVGKDGKANICAKGLSGEGYEGHYFWDTEIYVLPFFIYTMPEIARGLLHSRYEMLDRARARAQELSYKGSMYAWRTINGDEASAYYPAGTAQIHINADIAYSIERYVDATGDVEFLEKYGYEMLIEIARFFADFADHIPGKGWCINGVTGPDEYHTMTNNNAYTNLMVQRQFKVLLDLLGKDSMLITQEERQLWSDIAENISIKKDGLLTAQDDQFFERKPWDNKRRPKRPLLLHYHPMTIYNHQVLKQADLVLAMLLCHDQFTLDEKKANYDFYEPLTTHDSSLSETIHGIIASEIGHTKVAYQYLHATVTTDLLDTHKNTKDGIHIAAMAGGWQSLVYGFGGMRVGKNSITFNPTRSSNLQDYEFSILYQGVKITVNVNEDDVTVMTDKDDYSFELIVGNEIF